jgi:hypothetical protein
MIRIHTRSIAAACAFMAAAALPVGAHACSVSRFPVFGGSANMIATATADTLPAGPGDMRYEVDARRSGGAAPREVYGQVVRVERLGSAAAGALPAGTDRVVLVPWDLAPDCKTLLWTASARWMEPGARGLFHAWLRDPAHWVAGLPTLDVHQPWTQPYPDDVILRHRAGPLLTAEEAFELLETLPTYEEHTADGERAWARLREWVRVHPELACRFPATDVLPTAEDIGDVSHIPCASDASTGQGNRAAVANDGCAVQPPPGVLGGGGRVLRARWGRPWGRRAEQEQT